MILAGIIACEIGFWVFIMLGLIARYPARRPRLGAVLLICGPALDIALLALVTVDLLHGGTASLEHALAAIYIGVSIAYGHRMVAWADIRFKHRFAGGPKPVKLTGSAYTRKCWHDVSRTLIMVAITGGISGGLIMIVNDPPRTATFEGNFWFLRIILTIDTLWAISYSIWPKEAKKES